MIAVRRLLAVGVILSLAALLASSHVWGEPDRNEREKRRIGGVGGSRVADRVDPGLADELARSRFADSPVVVFGQEQGDQYFALQVKPRLGDVPARPRDYVVVVDTSASKAQ